MSTSRFGCQSPARTVLSPPRTRNRPPAAAIAPGEAALYCSYCSGSVMSVSTIRYAGMEETVFGPFVAARTAPLRCAFLLADVRAARAPADGVAWSGRGRAPGHEALGS